MDETTLNITSRIKNRITETDPTAKVILFGSRARGNAGKDSDWDILVLVGKHFKSRSEEEPYRDGVFDIELDIEQPISLFIVNESEWEGMLRFSSLYQNVHKEGIAI